MTRLSAPLSADARRSFADFGATPPKWQVRLQPPSRCAQARQTMPTGFFGVPPAARQVLN